MQIRQKTSKLKSQLLPLLTDSGLLLISFYTSLMLAPLFKLPFKNTYEISNPLNPVGFNPDNNFYGLLFIIFFTVGCFYLLRYIYRRRLFFIIKLLIIGLLVGNFFLFNSLPSPGYATGIHGLDNFHAGEELSPAYALTHGTQLYSDMFYLRGAGIDAVIPAMSFLTTGESIGSFLLQTDIMMLIALTSFLVLLAFLIRNPLLYGLAAVLFYVSNAVSLLHFRDVFVWLFIGLTILAFQYRDRVRIRRVLMTSVGFISSLTLYIAIDRGIILFAGALALAAGLVFIHFEKKQCLFSYKTWLKNSVESLFVLLGISIGLFIPAFFLGAESFVAFLKMSFIEIPRYGGLLVSQPFPDFFSDRYLIWGSVLLAIAVILLLVQLYRRGHKNDLHILVPLTIFFLIGLACIKGGANRIDLTKMASVITPLFFASILILVYAVSIIRKDKKSRTNLAFPVLATLIVLVAFAQLDFSKLLAQPSYTRSELKNYLQLPSTNDDMWISPETKAVRDYVTKNTHESDHIFAFTSDPAYYYLTKRQNPSRFYVSWFADPQPLTIELLNDLKAQPPKVIIYKEKTWMDAPDTISMESRIPEVNEWIRANYTKETIIGNTTLLTR